MTRQTAENIASASPSSSAASSSSASPALFSILSFCLEKPCTRGNDFASCVSAFNNMSFHSFPLSLRKDQALPILPSSSLRLPSSSAAGVSASSSAALSLQALSSQVATDIIPASLVPSFIV